MKQEDQRVIALSKELEKVLAEKQCLLEEFAKLWQEFSEDLAKICEILQETQIALEETRKSKKNFFVFPFFTDQIGYA